MTTPLYSAELNAVLAAQRRCREQGLQTGNGGNVSVRIPGTAYMAVKASGAAFGDTTLDAAVVADFAGNPIASSRPPSKEALLHGAIYERMPEVGAIVHCHSPWTIAWASSGRAIPVATYHAALKLGGPVQVVDTGGYAVPPDRVNDVLAAFAGPPATRAMVLGRHGLVALGEDLDDALYNAELVEETAHVAVVSALLSTGEP